jgi:histidyl-tRNA synthetase
MIVAGTRSNSVRERLFTEKDLELGKMVTICRSAEQTHEQVQEMTVESRDEAAVAEMDANGRKFGQRQSPAFGKKCRRCGMYGHFSRDCPKRKVNNKE